MKTRMQPVRRAGAGSRTAALARVPILLRSFQHLLGQGLVPAAPVAMTMTPGDGNATRGTAGTPRATPTPNTWDSDGCCHLFDISLMNQI